MIIFNIKQLRRINNMSQKELANLSGIRLNTLSSYENSTTKTISIENINKLCEIFNCQISELMRYSSSLDDSDSDEYIARNETILRLLYENEKTKYDKKISEINQQSKILEQVYERLEKLEAQKGIINQENKKD